LSLSPNVAPGPRCGRLRKAESGAQTKEATTAGLDRGFNNPFYTLYEELNSGQASREFGNISAQYLANNRPDGAVRRMVSPLLRTGLDSLKSRFGAAH